jgi:hypothetical protein
MVTLAFVGALVVFLALGMTAFAAYLTYEERDD